MAAAQYILHRKEGKGEKKEREDVIDGWMILELNVT